MWNCAHTALLRAIGPEDGLLSVDNLRAIVWFPMYTAADCTLDMLVHLQTDLEKHAEKVGRCLFMSVHVRLLVEDHP